MRARARVLVVDDEQDIVCMTSEILKSMGLDVVTAASGPEALEKVAWDGRVDLLITDLIMPGMTGRMLADTVSSWVPGLEVLFMSAHIDDSRIIRVHEDLPFIQKPFRKNQLQKKVREKLSMRTNAAAHLFE